MLLLTQVKLDNYGINGMPV